MIFAGFSGHGLEGAWHEGGHGFFFSHPCYPCNPCLDLLGGLIPSRLCGIISGMAVFCVARKEFVNQLMGVIDLGALVALRGSSHQTLDLLSKQFRAREAVDKAPSEGGSRAEY